MLLVACVNDAYHIQRLDAVDIDNVELYYTRYPSCDYERVGFIESTGAYMTKGDTFDFLMQEAAKMGADGVIVDYLHRSEIKYYSVVGEAIRCLDKKLPEPEF